MDRQRPFRFGVIVERMSSSQAWMLQARAAQEAGYATLLLRDHFIRIDSRKNLTLRGEDASREIFLFKALPHSLTH